MRWRWLKSPDAPAALQMAVDVGLMDRARETGESVLRVYGWARPTLSFGRHETVLGRYDPSDLARAEYDAVRRPTGGRVLLHDGEVTYSVTAPATDDEPLRVAYERINRLLAAALVRLGVRAEGARAVTRERRPGRDACFAAPSAGELVVDGRKLVASAQRRADGALLQHGSILLVDRQATLAALAREPMPLPAPAATLESALGRPVGREEVGAALRAALEAEIGPVAPLPPDEAARHATAHLTHFADPRWTWLR